MHLVIFILVFHDFKRKFQYTYLPQVACGLSSSNHIRCTMMQLLTEIIQSIFALHVPRNMPSYIRTKGRSVDRVSYF